MLRTILLGLMTNIVDGFAPTENSNFSKYELGIIANGMGNDMTMRMSPKGNPILTHRNTEGNNVIFSFYKRDNGYLIRRRLGYDNPFGSGNILNGGKPFVNLGEAMAYFKNYKEEHPNSIVG